MLRHQYIYEILTYETTLEFWLTKNSFDWDSYITKSIKGEPRLKSDAETRRQVLFHVKLSKNWQDFLCNSSKTEEHRIFLKR